MIGEVWNTLTEELCHVTERLSSDILIKNYEVKKYVLKMKQMQGWNTHNRINKMH